MNGQFDYNLFSYCGNNPIIRIDENGHFWETVFDIFSIGYSAKNLFNNPSLGNVGYLAWDIAASLLPFVPGSYIVKSGKLLLKMEKGVEQVLSKVNLMNKLEILH